MTPYNVLTQVVDDHTYVCLYTDAGLPDVPDALQRWVLEDWHPFDLADGMRMAMGAEELMTTEKG